MSSMILLFTWKSLVNLDKKTRSFSSVQDDGTALGPPSVNDLLSVVFLDKCSGSSFNGLGSHSSLHTESIYC